ncbi:transcriptional repressor LexA [Methyloversatilis sp.]|uniref:transcriptional repressor LexA n=1 Tax=Methyloversatilis sp. TaxID=2569862 RepID=UPI0035AEF5B1
MSNDNLTARQQEILQLIRDAVSERGSPPTRAEIAQAFGFRSPNAAETHLRALARKGVICLDEGRARGIRLAEPPGMPLIGRVAAGHPILADAHVQGRYQIDPSMFSPRADYLLRVRGLSMRDAGILDGDLLAVHSTSEARTGQIIVARLHDEVTVKRLRLNGPQIELLPENPDFSPIVVDTRHETLVIEGVMVGLIRNGHAV